MKRQGLFIAVAALVVVVAAAAGGYYLFFQNNVQAQVEQTVRRMFANPPAPYTKATYDKLDVALASRRLTIDNIVLERSTPPYVIKIDRFEATGIDVDALQTVFDAARYKDGAPDQTFRKLADSVVLIKIDADSRDAGRLTIAQVTAQGVQAHQFSIKPDVTTLAATSERDRVFAGLDALRIDSVTYDSLTSGGAQMPSGTVRRIEIKDFSRQGVGSITAEDLDLKDPRRGSHTSWKRFQLRDIPGDPWFDYIVTGRPPSDVMAMIALGGITIADLKVESSKGSDPTVRIASYEMGKVDRKRLDSFTLSGLEVVGPTGGVTIGTIELKGLNWEQLLPLLHDPDWPSKARNASYGVDKFDIRDIGGQSMAALGARLREILLSAHIDIEGGKADSVFNITGFELDTDKVKDAQTAGLLKALGYDKLNLSLESSGTGDDKTGVSTLDKLRIFGPQVGELSLNFKLSDLKRPPPSSKPPEVMEALQPLLAAKLENLKLSWKDDSLTGRILKVGAAQQGMSAEQMRDGLIMQVKAMSQDYAGTPAVAAAFQAVIDYLNKPGTLTVEFHPPVPTRFGELGPLFNFDAPPDVPKIFEVLGIKVTAN